MQTVTTVGFDIAKSVFQVHGVDAFGQVVIRRRPEASQKPGSSRSSAEWIDRNCQARKPASLRNRVLTPCSKETSGIKFDH
jgi:hypothetical protein